MDFNAPDCVSAATVCAAATVAASKGGVSKAPSGPFQTRVEAARSRASKAATLCGPTSKAIMFACTPSTPTVRVGGLARNSSATTRSTGSRISQFAALACSMICRAVACISASCRDLPMPWPCAARKVLAMAPPITSTSTLLQRLPSNSSLVETLAPPTMATTGRAGLPSAASSAFNSASMSRPA